MKKLPKKLKVAKSTVASLENKKMQHIMGGLELCCLLTSSGGTRDLACNPDFTKRIN
jgi:hypothetical protein